MSPDAISGFILTAECPSEAVLDAYELKEAVAPAASQHIDRCSVCIERLRERKSAFEALDRDAIIRAIHVTTASEQTIRRPLLNRAIAALSFAVALGVAALIFVKPTDDVRQKGSIGFEVFVEREGIVHRAVGGSQFRPGDRLRFEVDLPDPAHVMIVGVEAGGSMYNAYPATTSVAAALAMPKGADQILPGAVELDERLGRETLHLVACERAFDSTAIKEQGGQIILPEGCIESPFVLKKVD